MGKSFTPPPPPDPRLMHDIGRGFLGAPGPFDVAERRRERVTLWVLCIAGIAIPAAAAYGIYVFVQLALAEWSTGGF